MPGFAAGTSSFRSRRLASAKENRNQSQELDVRPDERDRQTERPAPVPRGREAALDAIFDEVEVCDQGDAREEDSEQAHDDTQRNSEDLHLGAQAPTAD